MVGWGVQRYPFAPDPAITKKITEQILNTKDNLYENLHVTLASKHRQI